MTTEPKSDRFEHVKNITVGQARVIWAPVQHGYSHYEAFHLPGGRTTQVWDIAYAVCCAMNALMPPADKPLKHWTDRVLDEFL